MARPGRRQYGARGGAVSLSSTASLILSDSAATQAGLVFRPSILQSSGFADLTLTATGNVRLDGVNLTTVGARSRSAARWSMVTAPIAPVGILHFAQ